MRVLFLQRQPCMRALKYAVGLRSVRPDITLGFAFQGKTLTEWYGTGDELFDSWWRLDACPRPDLERAVAAFAPDLIHSHNLPDSLTVLALELIGRTVPVVHDVHDLQSLRRTPYEDGFPEPEEPLELEKRAVQDCAGLLTVSEELVAAIEARYRPPTNTVAFPNYALARDLPRVLPPRPTRREGPPRLVYQGTLSTNGGHYDLREIFAGIVAEGIELDVYPARAAPEYEALADRCPGMRCHATLDPPTLLSAMTEYDFGWAGFNATLNAAHLDTVLPNKVFEYLGCGLPVLTLDHRALARFVRESGLGMSLPGLDGLADRLASVDLVALRQRVIESRSALTIEANIHRVIALYEAVLAGAE